MTAFQVIQSSTFLRISCLPYAWASTTRRVRVRPVLCCRNAVSTERGVGSRWYVSAIARTHGRARARQFGQWGSRQRNVWREHGAQESVLRVHALGPVFVLVLVISWGSGDARVAECGRGAVSHLVVQRGMPMIHKLLHEEKKNQ